MKNYSLKMIIIAIMLLPPPPRNCFQIMYNKPLLRHNWVWQSVFQTDIVSLNNFAYYNALQNLDRY